ncbi:hypothetical protein [Actinoplanes missouriensis]|uniref:hypothetical protein n=1 Tax=Actinoplanes missouriensis TaxID=1866 RepID=UPI0002F182ED
MTAPPSTPCIHPWCGGLYCAAADNGERFHLGVLSAEGGPDEFIGVDVVRHDAADGTSEGTLVDITYTDHRQGGLAQRSVTLSPAAALRHGLAVVRAALFALARR